MLITQKLRITVYSETSKLQICGEGFYFFSIIDLSKRQIRMTETNAPNTWEWHNLLALFDQQLPTAHIESVVRTCAPRLVPVDSSVDVSCVSFEVE
jgi:hypothetical protein